VNTLLNTFGAPVGTGNVFSVTAKLRFPDSSAPSPSSQSTGGLIGTTAFLDTTLLDDRRRVGPYILDLSRSNTQALQLGICALYILTLLFAAFLSPLTLLVTLWRMTAFLAGYAVFSRVCGWDGEGGADLLLVPALCIIRVVGKELRKVVQRYTEWKIGVKTRALREVLREAEVAIEAR
jgi:hypothetical protein